MFPRPIDAAVIRVPSGVSESEVHQRGCSREQEHVEANVGLADAKRDAVFRAGHQLPMRVENDVGISYSSEYLKKIFVEARGLVRSDGSCYQR